MLDESLRRRALEAMLAGELPRQRPSRMWGGPGSGGNCAVCGTGITSTETAFEVEFASEAEGANSVSYYFHVPCLAAWEFERDDASSVPVPALSHTDHSDRTCGDRSLHQEPVNLKTAAASLTILRGEREPSETGAPE